MAEEAHLTMQGSMAEGGGSMRARLGAAMSLETRGERGEQMDRILGLSASGESTAGAGSPASEPAVKPGKVLTASERQALEQEKIRQSQEKERRRSVHMEKVAMLKGMLAHQKSEGGPVSFP